jgi:hypothetical protein
VEASALHWALANERVETAKVVLRHTSNLDDLLQVLNRL